MRLSRSSKIGLFLSVLAVGGPLAAGEWPAWRGPRQDGVSLETGLVSKWSPQGENLAWHVKDLTGRSTPVVFDGRVCANGRAGEGVDMHEVVACFDAGTGKELWRRRLDVYHTAVPFNRVGWASVVGDSETGNLYACGVGGLLVAFDRAGKVVWQRSLTEEFGFYSGFGGRTHTPMVDEDRLVLSFTNAGWGEQAPPRTRTFAFDKRTGAVLWVSTPGGQPYDLNTQTTPVVAVVNGQRLLIEGNGDGWIYAIKARTGEKVWGFQLSKSGINTTVAVNGTVVYAAHSEENVDTAVMGRVVAIDATGTGEITKTHELWRAEELGAGFPSPLYHDGRLYVVDNSANLFALDARTGRHLFKHKLGTVGKASPVWADGKIYVPETNGRFHILKPGADGFEQLDIDELSVTDGAGTRYAEIYGSPAVAYGRVYFTTEGGLYCLGDKAKPFKVTKDRPDVLIKALAEEPAAKGASPAVLQVVPAEVLVEPGETVRFTVKAFDAKGRPVPAPAGVEWSLAGLAGTIEGGALTPAAGRAQAGKVVAKGAGLEAAARVRAIPPLPWSEDFEAYEVDKNPAWWIGAGIRFLVKDQGGNKVLVKPPSKAGVHRADVYMGPARLANYTIEADLLGTAQGRKRPDMGVHNSGYTMDLMGAHQKIQVRSWASDLRLEKSVPFAWDSDVWYTVKFRVDQQGDKALVRGKVWKRGEPEPAEWMVTAEDPHPVRSGSPGLYGYSPVDIQYDNVKVTVNSR
ncbi:MAG TPA: PQQ-binding-like beta-propeller repeat protein [Thermoanaerobaculia bacterium]|jgi:outer membrane protein assembly factor BamB